MSQTTPFSATGLSESLPLVGATALLVQMVSEALVVQPPVAVDAVPTLPADQLAVQQVASSDINLAASQLGLSATVLGYANKFLAMYDQLLALAEQIDDPETSPEVRSAAVTTFVDGINNLMEAISRNQATVNSIQADTSQLTEQATAAQGPIDADLVLTQQVLADSEIPALEAQLTTIQQAIDADNQIIAKATLHDIVDGAKMALGIYKMGDEEFRDGLKMLIGAVEDAASTSVAIQQASADVKKQLTLYQETLEALTADQITWAIVQNLAANADLLTRYAVDSERALQAFDTAWQAQSDSLDALADSLISDGGDAPESLTALLAASVQTAWIDLKKLAVAMQETPIVHITTFSDTIPL